MQDMVHLRSAAFPNVFVRLDGTGVVSSGHDGGVANCQFGAGAYETFKKIVHDDQTWSFESYAFPGVFLRMDGNGIAKPTPSGGGHVNGQVSIGPWERYAVVYNADNTNSIGSTFFPNIFLRADGSNVKEFAPNGAGTVNCQFSTGTYVDPATNTTSPEPWEKFVICDCITADQCHGAIDQFIEWFPEEAAQINLHRDDIVACCCPPFKTSTPLETLQALRYAATPVIGREGPEPDDDLFTPCQIAIGSVIFDVLSLAMSLVGLYSVWRNFNVRRLYEPIGERIYQLKRLIYDIQESENGGQLAKNVFKLLSQIWDAGMFRSIWNHLKDEMSWWKWITSGIIAVAQIVAWFATEGIAFIAECVLILPSIGSLAVHSIEVHKQCNA